MLAVAIPAGLLIGFSLGALGGGGSILTVPALVYLLHQQPHAATTGSLLIVGITALAGMIAHQRAGRVRVAQGVTFGVLGVAGPRVAPWPSRAWRTGTATLDRAADAARPRARRSWRRPAIPGAVKIVTAATAVGLLTGFFGVGGGFVIVPALVLALGFEMPAAVGTSLLVIAINSAASLAARFSGHVHLDWPLLLTFLAAALAGTFAGNRAASRVDATRLSAAFSVLLAAVAVYSLCRSLPGLV